MKKNTIKWKIFKYNIIVIILLILLVTVIFNVAVRLYIENDIFNQLDNIASRTEHTALQKGPDFFGKPDKMPIPPELENADNDMFRYYFMLDRSLREPLSVLNADFILLGSDKQVINPLQGEYFNTSQELINQVTNEINNIKDLNTETYLDFNISGTKYAAIIKPVSDKNTFGLGWIVIYSSLEKVYQLQIAINIILFIILVLSSLIIMAFSSKAAKKISEPFSSLNDHIRSIAERNFSNKIAMSVDDELQELVNNINVMSEKLESYDLAQKTFLQNASHEFRTPLTSIQSYAEGIKYGVVDDTNNALDIILSETKRISNLVEELLYLSRLDTIEENFHTEQVNLTELTNSCIERMKATAASKNINFELDIKDKDIKILADEEKISRAITNIISNCIRYAKTKILIKSNIADNGFAEISINDDGSGFDASDLPNLFERFYKGKNGNFGLGLAITKNIIEKHNGKIGAKNTETGAKYTILLPYIQDK